MAKASKLLSRTLWAFFIIATAATAIRSNAPQQNDSATERANRDRLARHASLFSQFDVGKPVSARSPKADGSIDLSVDVLNEYAAAPGQVTTEDELRWVAKACPVLVTGTAKQRRSGLTPRQAFVYSDWDIVVADRLKNGSPVSTERGATINVTRPGGELVVGGRRVTAHDRNFADFAPGKTYLLCLRPLPDNDTFYAEAHGTFELGDSSRYLNEDPALSTTLRTYARGHSGADLVSGIKAAVEGK